MEKKSEKVTLLVHNVPGVLGRLVSQIRVEGWNIKSIHAQETEVQGFTELEIEIEAVNSKLALIGKRMLNIDCVVSVTVNGVCSKRTKNEKAKTNKTKKIKTAPEKPEGAYRILAINPGSTSTKFAVYDDEEEILVHTITHDQQSLESCGGILEQKSFRRACIEEVLAQAEISLSDIDAVSGRGGLVKPIESGTYLVNDRMIEDLNTATASIHASALGALLAREIAEEVGINAYVVDPVVVDEMDRLAKLSGIPGIERNCAFHALNQKAMARKLSEKIGKPYENSRFVVAHMGGGITVGAHRYGRVIDVNDGISGEGPFSPERSGAASVSAIIDMCFSGEYTEKEMHSKVVGKGGVSGYLGTNDIRKVEKMINDGDEFAALVLDSMAYQVSKEIGAMCAVLEGRVDGIILTGGLAHSSRFTGSIKQRVDRLAEVHVYAGENEMLALMNGALRILKGEERISVYE